MIDRDLAEWFLPSVPRVSGHEEQIAKWRYGCIELQGGGLRKIQCRWWPRLGSLWGAQLEQWIRRLPSDQCRYYYSLPRSTPGFLSLLYCHAGPMSSYSTVAQGLVVLDAVAKTHQAQAIVCQATNNRISARIMQRFGYQLHAPHLGNNHYIKRFNS